MISRKTTREGSPGLDWVDAGPSVVMSPAAAVPQACSSSSPARTGLALAGRCPRVATTFRSQGTRPSGAGSGLASPENSRCVWALISPGINARSPRSVAEGSGPAKTAEIRPPQTSRTPPGMGGPSRGTSRREVKRRVSVTWSRWRLPSRNHSQQQQQAGGGYRQQRPVVSQRARFID